MNSPISPRLSASVFAIALLAAGPIYAAAPTAPTPAKPVDKTKLFVGKWIEIGRRPMKLTDGCVAGATNYMPQGGDKIDVTDSCNEKTPTGKLKTISGAGKIVDPGTNTKLHVNYRFLGFVPVGRDYWILDHDDAYSWFIASNPDFTDLWIYTRATRPDPDLVKTLVEKARLMGYDVTKLEFPAQP